MMSDTEKNLTTNQLNDFDILVKQLEGYQKQLEQSLTTENLSQIILKEFLNVSNFFISIGDKEFSKIQTSKNFNFTTLYILNYLLPESFKNLMLIHRDVFLQLQISKNKKQEALVDEETIHNHFKESKEILLNAINSVIQAVITEPDSIEQNSKEKKKTIAKARHQQNPWEIYKGQFITIQNQVGEIEKSTQAISEIITVFKNIKHHTQDICTNLTKEVESSKRSINQLIDSVQNLNEVAQISKTILLVDDTISNLEERNQQQENFALDIESKISTLKEYNIPIACEDGLLLFKKIDFNKSTKKWLNYILLPDLMELWQNRVNLIAIYKHSLLNLKSSLSLLKNNNSLATLPSQIQSLQNLLQSANSNQSQQRELTEQIQQNLTDSFLVNQVYKSDDFLKVSLQSSLSQFTSSKNIFFDEVQNKLKHVLSFFSTKYEISTTDNPFKKLEASSRCIDYRSFKASNIHYDTLFLNKSFIGDLFLVPRETEKQKLVETLNLWKKGHHKAVLVVGNNLSGKSTFIESVAKDYFKKLSIVLEVDSTISIEGRKFTTTKNLSEALQHIKKNTYNSRPLVVIDNLELWRDKNNSLLDNVNAAIQFVESESQHIFVIMTTSNSMQSHLDKRLTFSNSFSSIINVNKSRFEQISKAILLRHGASHQNLVSEKGLPLPSKQVELYIQKLCKNYDYNMGEVLQAWTYAINTVDNNEVCYQEKEFEFEDFFTTEELIILKYVLLYKHINEIILKNFLGKRYSNSYKSGLKRLVNTKVFLRNSEGNLILNSTLYHDIRQILKYRGVLN